MQHNISTFTGYLTELFKRRREQNQLPPHLAVKSIRHKAEEKQQTDALKLNLEKSGPRYKQVERAGDFYRKSFYPLQPAPMVRETLGRIEDILDRIDPQDQNQIDTVVRMPRVTPETIKEASDSQAQQTPKDGIPVIMEASFKDELPTETMFLQAVRKCRFLHQSIPSCLCVNPLLALNHPSTTYTYGEVSPAKIIPVVPTRGLDEHIVRCFANPRKIS